MIIFFDSFNVALLAVIAYWAAIYLFKVKNWNRIMCEICSKVSTKDSNVILVSLLFVTFEQISLILVFPMLTFVK